MISRNGICYDLDISPHKATIDGLTYVLSSKLHLDKFKGKLQENRDIINYSLTKRFNYNVDVSQLADIVLYKRIETRGFLIITHKGIKLCQNNITFAGGVATIQS